MRQSLSGIDQLNQRITLRPGNGAETYNEPGRAFWAGVNVSF